MHILLFIIYSVVLAFLATRLPFVRRSPLRTGVIIAYFFLHTAIGCLHTWIAWRYFPAHGDIWRFFTDSFVTRQELRAGFRVFWADNHRLVDLPHNFIEWLHVVFNMFSFDNLYINTLFFSFITLGGYCCLFEVLYRRLNGDLICALTALFLPSILFWTSCIHTEGLVYPLLGWLVYLFDRSSPQSSSASGDPSPPPSPLRVLGSLVLTGFIIFQRPAIAIGLLPIPGIWLLATQVRSFRTRMAASFFVGFCLTAFLMFSPHFLAWLSNRQAEFQLLEGGSKIYLPVLEPDFPGFLHVLPTAVFNSFIQPLPGATHQPIYLAFFAELMLIWAVILVSCLNPTFRRSQTATDQQWQSLPTQSIYLSILCLLFAIPCILLVGLIVPFVGAIVRYRSLYLPFLLIPFLHRITSRFPQLNHRLSHLLLKRSHF